MNIVITGVAGFIGSHLADKLLEMGHRVIGFDNFSYGAMENLEKAVTYDRFTLHRGDIRIQDEIEPLVAKADCLYHLAAYKIPRYQDALDTLSVNGLGSNTVLHACATHEVPIIAASTSDVYGMNDELPFSENDTSSVIGPPTVRRWAYAVSKMYEEQLCFAFSERYNFPAILVRFFGGYGPRHNLTWWGGPQSGFITKALNDQPLEVHGDGCQTRSFTYIADHIDALASMLTLVMESKGCQVLNSGGVEEISIMDLARLIWRLIRDDEPKINLIPYATFGKYQDVRRRIPNQDKMKELLGRVPVVDLKTGLEQTIVWQRKKLGL